MGSGFSKMKKQARLMEAQYEKMRAELKNQIFTGTSGGGLVTVVLTGEKELKEIKIKPDCVDPQDVEGLQDLILAAHAEALKASTQQSNQLGSFGGMD